jgi:hypothetical protein
MVHGDRVESEDEDGRRRVFGFGFGCRHPASGIGICGMQNANCELRMQITYVDFVVITVHAIAIAMLILHIAYYET